jgi:hypothetical protein
MALLLPPNEHSHNNFRENGASGWRVQIGKIAYATTYTTYTQHIDITQNKILSVYQDILKLKIYLIFY